MAILTSRIYASFLVLGAVLMSSFAIPLVTVPMAGTAHAQEKVDDMVIKRIGLIDLEWVLRASKGTAKVRELLDNQRLLFQQEFSEHEAALQQTERELTSQRELLSKDVFAEKLSQFEVRRCHDPERDPVPPRGH